MNKTKIEYLNYTWNPIVGCSGLGCAVRKNCWASKQEKRRKHECEACYTFTPHVHWERLEQPFTVKKSSRIGVAFCGEFYDKEISENARASIFMRIEKAYWHTFVIFTKQPQNIDLDEPIPKNVWLCVSVNRKQDLWRIANLRETSATIKGVSFEPLYEDLSDADLDEIDWIVIGAQTRPNVYPKYDWVIALMQKHIPVFLKNNLLPIMATDKLCKEFPKVGG
jgi:protein gp37